MSNFQPVSTFPTRQEAELAKGLLESHGIHSYIGSHDGGGVNPDLAFAYGVQLMVDANDINKAKQVLELERE